MRLVYRPDLFDRGDGRRARGPAGVDLRRASPADPDRPSARLDLLAPAERDRVLVEWNDTAHAGAGGGRCRSCSRRRRPRTPERTGRGVRGRAALLRAS